MNKTFIRVLGAAAFFVPLVLYLVTICPTVHLGDSGELNLAAATLSIPHVPGYPLLVKTAHMFCRLPFGNGAMRGNLFSVFFGAFACFLLYKFLLWRFNRPMMAFAFAICLAGSLTLWEQSLKIRAYPLNTCFAIGTIFLTMLWRKNHDRRYLYSLAFLFGLGLTNHEILLVTATVPFVAMVADIRKLRVTDVVVACVFGLIGLSVYGYLPLRAMTDPVLNWGDPSSLDRFLDVILQHQYSGKMLNPDWGAKLLMVGMILKAFTTEFGPLIAVCGLFGLVFAWRREKALTAGLLLLILFNIALRINYIGEHEFHQVLRYMISSFVAFLIFAAFLTDGLLTAIAKSTFTSFSRRVIAALFLLGIAIPSLLAHGHRNNLSNHRVGYDYIQSILLFPENGYAIGVGGDNDIFNLWYLKRFERFREDVVAIPKQGFRAKWLIDDISSQLPDGMTETRIRYVDLGVDKRFYSTLDRLIQNDYPVYSLFDTTTDDPGAAAMQDLTERFGLNICGIALRFKQAPPFCDVGSPLWQLYPFDLMIRQDVYRDFHTSDLLENASVMVSRHGLKLAEKGDLNEAIHLLSLAVLIHPDVPFPKLNLANTLARAGFEEKALELYEELIARFPDDKVFRHNRDLIENVMKGRKGQ